MPAGGEAPGHRGTDTALGPDAHDDGNRLVHSMLLSSTAVPRLTSMIVFAMNKVNGDGGVQRRQAAERSGRSRREVGDMRYMTFGRRTGLRVSELALGAATFGTAWGYGAAPAEARRLFDGYAEAGGNFIDTADSYQNGQSEALLADFLAADREHFVLASKYTQGIDAKAGISRTGNSRKAMVSSLEASLKRLKTDRLDLYWVHMADGVTPLEEIVRGFDDLVRAGKIHYGGLSDFPAWRISRAATLAELRGWAPLAGIQIEYSLVERTADRELLPMAEALGLAVTLWSPLGGGYLTGKHRRGEEGRLERMKRLVHTETSAQKSAVLDAVLAVAEETGAPAAQVAIAWLLERSRRSPTALVPILGAATREQLDDNLAAARLRLDEAQMDRLDAASAVPLGFPHEMLAADGYIQRYTGGVPALRRPLGPPVA